MKYILDIFRGKVEKVQVEKSPVYAFFAEASAEVKTKAYKKALRGASDDQMRILSKYDKEFAHIN
jgi:hypothetical protein